MTTTDIRWSLGTVRERDAPQTVIVHDGAAYGLPGLLARAGIHTDRPEATTLEILSHWNDWLPDLHAAAATIDASVAPNAGVDWLPPVVYPEKLICVGANYGAHNREMGIQFEQTRPFVFLKPPTTSLVGHRGEIGAPEQVQWLDWEGELALVIGQTLHHGSGPSVMDAVAGYTCLNDVSARDWSADLIPGLGQDWFMHKAFDAFTPLGPSITPAEFVPDPQNLRVELLVDGVVKQAASTSGMVFSIIDILEHVSGVTTLRPGDIVATGSPPGVGFGRSPREHLKPGDDVIVRIEGLEELRNVVGARTPAVAAVG